MEVILRLTPCTIGMEACGSAHHWAREFAKLGHAVRLISPQFVKPFVKGNKTDSNDAEAICVNAGLNLPHLLAYRRSKSDPPRLRVTRRLSCLRA